MRDTTLIDTMRSVMIDAQKAASSVEIATEDNRRAVPAELRRQFVLAGNCTVTLKSLATQTRFTYNVTKSDDGKLFFVALLNGPDNTSDFTYMGIIDARGEFRTTAKSRVTADAVSFKAFRFLTRNWTDARIEVWTEGKCGRCNRKLTVPESLERGLGPECAGKLFD